MKYVGKGMDISPLSKFFTFSSSSGDVLTGSAKKSPSTIASENEFLECNLNNFSKTVGNCP